MVYLTIFWLILTTYTINSAVEDAEKNLGGEMGRATQGLICAFSFVILEAAQVVFFGGVFQAYDSHLIGTAVFGLSALATLAWTALKTPDQLRVVWVNKAGVLGLNLSTTIVWTAYFFTLQMVEPAVVFTVFSGLIPMTVLIAARFGVPEASDLRNHVEGLGLLIVALGVCFLCAITLLGQSDFVRGGWFVALAGLALTCISAVSLTVMMFQSRRLDRLGVAPVAQYGLRFPLYVVVALFAAWLGVDAKGPVDPRGFALVVLVGFVVIAFPVVAMQKAMSLISTLALAAITVLGPLFVFLSQLEGRVDCSPITMTGLMIYFAGALLAVRGGAKTPSSKAAKR